MAWITTEFKSQKLKMPVEAEILVPQPGYKTLTQEGEYKVIVLLHGANNDRTEWLLKSRIYDYVKELPVLVFMPSGKNSFYVNTANGYDYMDFVTEEIPEYIKRRFNVSERHKDWLIAGESMGGYGAFVCGFNCPDVFGNIASFSGAVDILSDDVRLHSLNMDLIFGKDAEMLKKSNYNLFEVCHRVEGYNRPEIFMSCGKQDRLYNMNVRLYEEIKNDYQVIFKDGDGGHDFDYWDDRLKEMLDWFMNGEAVL